MRSRPHLRKQASTSQGTLRTELLNREVSQLRRAARRSETAFSTPSSSVSDLHVFRFRKTTDNQAVGLLVDCSSTHHQIQYSLMSAVNLVYLDYSLQYTIHPARWISARMTCC